MCVAGKIKRKPYDLKALEAEEKFVD